MIDVIASQRGEHFVSLSLACAREELNEQPQFLGGEFFLKQYLGDSQEVKKGEEFLDMGLFRLIKGSFKIEDISGAAQKQEIEIAQGTLELPMEFCDVLVEDIMAARVKAGAIDGTHE